MVVGRALGPEPGSQPLEALKDRRLEWVHSDPSRGFPGLGSPGGHQLVAWGAYGFCSSQRPLAVGPCGSGVTGRVGC